MGVAKKLGMSEDRAHEEGLGNANDMWKLRRGEMDRSMER